MTIDRLSQAARRQQRSPASAPGHRNAKTPGTRAASPLPMSGSPNRSYGAWRPSAAYWPERIRVR
jgi:hypothetical protein